MIVHRADGALLKQGVRTAKDKIDVPCDLAVPVILGSRAAGRKAARAQKAVLLPLLLRQRGAEQGVLIAQQPHIRKKRAGTVHVSRHSLTHLGPGTGIILDGQIFHPQTFSAEKSRVAAEGMDGPAVRVRQPAAVAPHDAGPVHACNDCYASFMKRFTGHTEEWGTFLDVKHWPEIKNPKKYAGQRVVIGSVTDGYNPQEEQFRNTRKLLEQLIGSDADILICTKSDLVVRDIDLLKKLGRVTVSWSINTLDENFKNDMDLSLIHISVN